MENEVISKIKQTVNQGIATVSAKTNSLKERTIISSNKESIEKELNNLYKKLGKEVYELMDKKQFDFNLLYPLFETIQGKNKNLEDLNKKLEAIKEEENKKINSYNAELLTCPNCGKPYSKSSKFCCYCGYNLENLPKYICPSCGEIYHTPTNFCMKCGSRVIKDNPTKTEGE